MSVVQEARRIVVKVGSSLVTNEGRGLDEAAIGEWARQLAALVRGHEGPPRELIMVSSGAVAEGMKRLGWKTRPKELHELQAAAAVGQMGLVQMYETKLRDHQVGSAQTQGDLGRLLAELPGKMRLAVQAVKIDGLSVVEAARKYDMSESAVKVNVHRGLKALTAAIARRKAT